MENCESGAKLAERLCEAGELVGTFLVFMEGKVVIRFVSDFAFCCIYCAETGPPRERRD